LAVGVRRAAMSPETFCNMVRPLAVGHTPKKLHLRRAHSIRDVPAPQSFDRLGGS